MEPSRRDGVQPAVHGEWQDSSRSYRHWSRPRAVRAHNTGKVRYGAPTLPLLR